MLREARADAVAEIADEEFTGRLLAALIDDADVRSAVRDLIPTAPRQPGSRPSRRWAAPHPRRGAPRPPNAGVIGGGGHRPRRGNSPEARGSGRASARVRCRLAARRAGTG